MPTSRRRKLEAAAEVEPEIRAQLQFYGEGTAELILRNLKLGTCRVSNDKYTFTPGQIVEGYCRDDNEAQVPLIILNVRKRTNLGKIPVSVLSLDGYFDYDQAFDDLRRYYPKLDWTTKLDYVTFMTLDRFNKFDQQTQSDLTCYPTESLLRAFDLRDLFHPTIAYWMGVSGGNYQNYHEFLFHQKLVYSHEVEKFRDAILDMTRQSDITQITELMNRLKNLAALAQLDNSTDPLYAWTILLRKPD